MARQCGDCKVCCTRAEVEELSKPLNVACQHQCVGGCAIYPSRPQACAEYRCAWLSGYGKPGLRPDLSGWFGEILMWPLPGRLYVIAIMDSGDGEAVEEAMRSLVEDADPGVQRLDIVIAIHNGEVLIGAKDEADGVVGRQFLAMMSSGKAEIIYKNGIKKAVRP